MGRGIYQLQTPPSKILDQFKINLTASGSDVRMLELSMQPTKTSRQSSWVVFVLMPLAYQLFSPLRNRQ